QHGAVLGVLRVGLRRATFQAHRIVAMVAGHRDVHALVVGIAAAFDVSDRAEGDVSRVLVLLAASGFAGMAADAVVGRKEETVLLVAVRVATHFRIAVDVQRRTGLPLRIQLEQVDLLAIAVDGFYFLVGEQRVGALFRAHFPQRAMGRGDLALAGFEFDYLVHLLLPVLRYSPSSRRKPGPSVFTHHPGRLTSPRGDDG